MNTLKFGTVMAFVCMAGAASAGDGIVEQCYAKTYVGAKYDVTQHKVRGEFKQYVDHGNGKVELVRHPAWYVEKRTKVRDDRYVLSPVPCH